MRVQPSGTQAGSYDCKKPSVSLLPLFLRPYAGSYPFSLIGAFWRSAAGQVQDDGVKSCEMAELSRLCQWNTFNLSACE